MITKTTAGPDRALLDQLNSAVEGFLLTPEGRKIAAKLPKVPSLTRRVRVKPASGARKIHLRASPTYMKALKEIALAFEAQTGASPSYSVIVRRSLEVFAKQLIKAMGKRGAMLEELRSLARHASAE